MRHYSCPFERHLDAWPSLILKSLIHLKITVVSCGVFVLLFCFVFFFPSPQVGLLTCLLEKNCHGFKILKENKIGVLQWWGEEGRVCLFSFKEAFILGSLLVLFCLDSIEVFSHGFLIPFPSPLP